MNVRVDSEKTTYRPTPVSLRGLRVILVETRLVRAIPSMLTIMNLACGIFSLVMAADGNYATAAILILIAAIFDKYDGHLARKLKAETQMGKELDSLADLVSFGVAPAFLAHRHLGLGAYGLIGCLPLLIFALSGATRLARFNSTEFTGVFRGVPITVCGFVVAACVLLNTFLPFWPASRGVAVSVLLVGSYLMLSNIPIKKRL